MYRLLNTSIPGTSKHWFATDPQCLRSGRWRVATQRRSCRRLAVHKAQGESLEGPSQACHHTRPASHWVRKQKTCSSEVISIQFSPINWHSLRSQITCRLWCEQARLFSLPLTGADGVLDFFKVFLMVVRWKQWRHYIELPTPWRVTSDWKYWDDW